MGNSFDGIPNENRIPKIYEYIHQNFQPFIIIDDHQIWIRNPKIIGDLNEMGLMLLQQGKKEDALKVIDFMRRNGAQPDPQLLTGVK